MKNDGKMGGLVIDMQTSWIRDYKYKGRLIANVRDFVDGMDAADIPYWIVEFMDRTATKDCVYGIKIPNGRLVYKRRPNAFLETGLRGMLLEEGVSEIAACGVCASQCVLKTIAGGREDFDFLIPRDSVARISYSSVRDYERLYEKLGVSIFSGYREVLDYAVSKNEVV